MLKTIITDLHSTMFIFILTFLTDYMICLMNLHSTMFIFIWIYT